MGILSGQKIDASLITPFNQADAQPASYDIHLGGKLLRYMCANLDIQQKASLYVQDLGIPPMGLRLEPGELYLGQSKEHLSCGNYAVQIVALSSLMRIGLQVGQGSWADPGFHGCLTLELSTLSKHPIMLYSGMRIAQLIFHEVSGPIIPYAGKYQYQGGPMAAKVDA